MRWPSHCVARPAWWNRGSGRRARHDSAGRAGAVIEAALRVPVYRERWARIDAGSVRTVADLPLLPAAGRTELASRSLEERLASGPDHPVLVVSTGTSGRSMESARSPE